MSSPLDDLLKEHELANEKYAKYYSACKGLEKKRNDAQKERSAVRQKIAAIIGPIPPKSLVMNHTGTRFYETQPISYGTYGRGTGAPISHYFGHRVLLNGTIQRDKGYEHMEPGSIVRVNEDHPVYAKWMAFKMRERIEGKKDDNY